MCSASLSVWLESLCVWSGLADAGACPLCLWACHPSAGEAECAVLWHGSTSLLRPCGMRRTCSECDGGVGVISVADSVCMLAPFWRCAWWFCSGQRAACGPPLVRQSGLSVTVSPSLFPTPPGFVKGHKQVGDGDTRALLFLPPSITECSRITGREPSTSTPKHNTLTETLSIPELMKPVHFAQSGRLIKVRQEYLMLNDLVELQMSRGSF